MRSEIQNLPFYKRYVKNKIFLTDEQEEELYKKMKEGDEYAREDLLAGHEYLVINLVIDFIRNYAPYGSAEDLYGEGWIGLMKAVDKYDFNKGKLRTYARPRIKQHMFRYLDKTRSIIRLPEPQTHALLKLLKIRETMEEELGREPTMEELMDNPKVISDHEFFQKSKKSKITLKEYVGLLKYGNSILSLDTPISEDSDSKLEDFIEDPSQQDDFRKIETEDFIERIMDPLDDREKFVLKSIAKEVTLQEIGNQLGISGQAVKLIKSLARRKIRAYVKQTPELQEIAQNMNFEI